MSVDVRTPGGSSAGSVELPAEIFDVQANIPLIHQVVVAQLAAARQGTHKVKSRGEVRGGGRKPYRQKGTGRARQGSIRAPHYAGGGVAHGPTPSDYSQRTPKKMKAAALRGALSDRAREGRVHVVSSLVEGATPSTKQAYAMLAELTDRRNVLVVLQRDDRVTGKSLRNLDHVHLLWPDQLNTYDVLVSDDVVFTQDALDEFLSRTGHSVTATDRPASAASTVAIETTAAPAESASEPELSGDTIVTDGSVATDEAVGTDATEEDDK